MSNDQSTLIENTINIAMLEYAGKHQVKTARWGYDEDKWPVIGLYEESLEEIEENFLKGEPVPIAVLPVPDDGYTVLDLPVLKTMPEEERELFDRDGVIRTLDRVFRKCCPQAEFLHSLEELAPDCCEEWQRRISLMSEYFAQNPSLYKKCQ